MMLGLLGFAIATALGQHAYYGYLSNREVDQFVLSQSWVIRIGTAFGFLFQSCLVASVAVAFCYAFWFTARRHAIRIAGLDSIFGVLQNPFKFFNRYLFSQTWILLVLAITCWLLPLAAIF